MKKHIITVIALFAGLTAFAQNQVTVMEEKTEMKDTVVVNGKLVEVGYRIIADGVTEGYKKIENGVVKGYKAIENGAVSGFQSVNDWFTSKLFQREGETLEETKARLKASSESINLSSEEAIKRSKEVSESVGKNNNGAKK